LASADVLPPLAVHVERTGDPAVLRWVCHDSPVRASPPGPRRPDAGSPVATLVAEGVVTGVWVYDGDVHARLATPAAAADVVRSVHAAVVDALVTRAPWLTRAAAAPPVPSLVELQAVVDRAASGVAELHGGHLLVVAASDTAVTVRPLGACRGCHLSASTLDGLVAPALRTAFPVAYDVVLERPARDAPRSRLPWPRRR
jgi:Fe-S cluster biogenesis protein NfuA